MITGQAFEEGLEDEMIAMACGLSGVQRLRLAFDVDAEGGVRCLDGGGGDREQKTENREPKAESRERKAENGKPKAENRERMAHCAGRVTYARLNAMKKVPFFANLPDGTHCYQAALKMVLTAFTKKDWSFELLDRLTGKLEGKWTWPTQSFIWMLENGFEIKLIEEFSYEVFAERGKDYLAEKCGSEVANAQEANSDLAREQQLAAEFIQKGGRVDHRIPTFNDLKNLLNEGYLIICNINANLLYGHAGYSGHFVLPIEITDQEIILHDPGLPPAPSTRVSLDIFEKAWGYPTEREKNILGIKKRL